MHYFCKFLSLKVRFIIYTNNIITFFSGERPQHICEQDDGKSIISRIQTNLLHVYTKKYPLLVVFAYIFVANLYFCVNMSVYLLKILWQFWVLRNNVSKVKLATIVEGDPKAPFSKLTTPRCRIGRYSFPWIAPLYPWSVHYNAEC